MTSIFRSHRPPRRMNERILTVEEGQVMCPRRGVVDIEDCWVCPAYRGLTGGQSEGLACSTKPMMLPFEVRGAIG
jgi:hypothetical protein